MPADDEMEKWAGLERRRREAWLHGPSETEKAIWAQRERERRTFAARGVAAQDSPARAGGYLRQLQLASEGAISLVVSHSLRDAFDRLRRSGREWEEEFSPPTTR